VYKHRRSSFNLALTTARWLRALACRRPFTCSRLLAWFSQRVRAVHHTNPPVGTLVRFVRDVAGAKAGAVATLVGSLFHYDEAQPGDEFEVEYRGRLLTVRRDEIESVNEAV
jgi:hypothetical protein